jgi:hypothetical protein
MGSGFGAAGGPLTRRFTLKFTLNFMLNFALVTRRSVGAAALAFTLVLPTPGPGAA